MYAKPHLGIVGEKGVELIVDHPTYAFLRRNNPEVLRAIYNARVFGRTMLDYEGLNRSATMLGVTSARGKARTAGVRTFADGNITDTLGGLAGQGTGFGGEAVNEQMSGVLQQLTAVLETMQRDGVRTDFHFGGRDGFSREEKKYNSWAKRHGM